jgi:hypothetical protein
MKRKVVSVLIATSLIASIMVGCGSNKSTSNNEAKQSTESTQSTSSDTESTAKVDETVEQSTESSEEIAESTQSTDDASVPAVYTGTITPVNWKDDMTLTIKGTKLEFPFTVQDMIDAGAELVDSYPGGIGTGLSDDSIDLMVNDATTISVYGFNPKYYSINWKDAIVYYCIIGLDPDYDTRLRDISIGSTDNNMNYHNIVDLYGEPDVVIDKSETGDDVSDDEKAELYAREVDTEVDMLDYHYVIYGDEHSGSNNHETENILELIYRNGCGITDAKLSWYKQVNSYPVEELGEYAGTKNWEDELHVNVNGKKITLPAKLSDFLDAGLVISEYSPVQTGTSYNSGYHGDENRKVRLVTPDEDLDGIDLYLYNPTNDLLAIEDCLVYKAYWYYDTKGDITIGSLDKSMTPNDLVELYGTPYKLTVNGGTTTISYGSYIYLDEVPNKGLTMNYSAGMQMLREIRIEADMSSYTNK